MKKKNLFIAFSFLLQIFILQAQDYTKLSPYAFRKMEKWKMTKLSTKALGLDSSTTAEYLPAFVEVNSVETLDALKAAGCRIRTKAGMMATADIPYDKVNEISQWAGVQYIDCARQLKMSNVPLDSAAVFSNIFPAYEKVNLPTPYTGKGVMVGIVDVGFDYTHPTLYDTTGTNYRLKFVWDQRAEKEYKTEADIQNAAYDVATEFHGTHVAGIAVGSGYTTNYRGAAFESDPYFVSTTLYDDDIVDGVARLFHIADSLDVPCVINISLGGFSTPRDGTNSVDRMINELTGPGRIVVASAGNSQLDAIFVEKEFLKQDTLRTFNNPFYTASTTDSYVSFCAYEKNTTFSVSASLYNRATGKILASTPFVPVTKTNVSSKYSLATSLHTYSVEFNSELNKNNGKYNMEAYLLYPKNEINSDEYILFRVASSSGKVQAWNLNENYEFSDLSLGLPYVSGTTEYLVLSPGDADSVIAVAAYASRLSYKDVNGGKGTTNYAKTRGGIASFSSTGPTADGRNKPDVAGPGVYMYSAYNSFYNSTYSPIVARTTFNGKSYQWLSLSGTSMSSPYVAGSIALWLQANPMLTPSQIKAVFSRTALQDQVMEYPNNTWGYGKMDVYKGLLDILGLPTDCKEITKEEAVVVYTDEIAGSFHLRWVEAPATFTLRVMDMSGKMIYQKKVADLLGIETTVCLGPVPTGIYTVQIESVDGIVVRKVRL